MPAGGTAYLGTMVARSKPPITEHAPYQGAYIALCPEDDLLAALEGADAHAAAVLGGIPERSAGFRYAAGKWGMRDVVQHLIDCERVFAYRALRFARRDATGLPGFDEDSFAAEAHADARPWSDLLAERAVVREGTLHLFRSLSDEAMVRSGRANGQVMSVRALGWCIAGHERHHLRILQERYLPHVQA